jgi:hypothetical protein
MLVASVLKYSTMQTDEQSARFIKGGLLLYPKINTNRPFLLIQWLVGCGTPRLVHGVLTQNLSKTHGVPPPVGYFGLSRLRFLDQSSSRKDGNPQMRSIEKFEEFLAGTRLRGLG